MSPNTTTGAYAVYSANGAFQPNISFSGAVGNTPNHQPYGWDQWTGIYNDYIVIGSKIRISAHPPNSTTPSTAGGIMGILLSDSPSPYIVTSSVGATTMMETGRSVYKQMAPNQNTGAIHLSKKFSAKKFWNVTNLKDNITRLGAPTSSNPSEQAYYQVYFFTNDTSVSTTTGPFMWVTLDYYVIFSGPSDLSPS